MSIILHHGPENITEHPVYGRGARIHEDYLPEIQHHILF